MAVEQMAVETIALCPYSLEIADRESLHSYLYNGKDSDLLCEVWKNDGTRERSEYIDELKRLGVSDKVLETLLYAFDRKFAYICFCVSGKSLVHSQDIAALYGGFVLLIDLFSATIRQSI